MTQTPTPMNARHKTQDTTYLVESIKFYMRREFEEMIATLDDPNFNAGYLGDAGTPVADQVIKLGKDVNEVLLTGRTFLRNNMVTPADADAAFAYLEGKGVWAP